MTAPAFVTPRRKKWLSTSVFLPGKCYGQKSLVGYSPWSCQEWDMTEHAETSPGGTKLEDLFFWPQLQLRKIQERFNPCPLHCHKDQDRASQVMLVVKNPPTNAGDVRDVGSILGLGRSSGGGLSNLLQYSCLGNPHGQRRLAGYSPQGCKELDTTEVTQHACEDQDKAKSPI